jgi:transcriptional antiterminator RfaH
MPLLPLEPFLYPQDLLTGPPPAAGGEARWWVLHTRPRAEKSLARRFLDRQVPFFLPLYKRQWRSRGRLLASHVPLFPGYVFLHGEGRERLQALETNLVAQVLPVADQGELHADLARVHSLMATGAPLTPEERLTPGTRVQIVRGSFAGLEGTVLREGRQVRLVVEVRFLHQGVSVELEPWVLEPLAARPVPVPLGPAGGLPVAYR